jgi:hypothetical protein
MILKSNRINFDKVLSDRCHGEYPPLPQKDKMGDDVFGASNSRVILALLRVRILLLKAWQTT